MDRKTHLAKLKNLEALSAYKDRLAQVQAQIARIQGALVTQVDDGRWMGMTLNWAHTGDLAHLADELKSAADFITGEAE